MEYQSDKGIHHYTKLGITNWSDMKTRAIAVSKLYVNFLYSLRFFYFFIWRPFCFSNFSQNLFGLFIKTSMQHLDSVTQEMSELCSILRFGCHFVFWWLFCFSKKIQNLFRLSTWTSMRSMDSVAQEIIELCSILLFGSHFVFQNCPYKLPCKIWSL